MIIEYFSINYLINGLLRWISLQDFMNYIMVINLFDYEC